jgi:hypothetical protein
MGQLKLISEIWFVNIAPPINDSVNSIPSSIPLRYWTVVFTSRSGLPIAGENSKGKKPQKHLIHPPLIETNILF